VDAANLSAARKAAEGLFTSLCKGQWAKHVQYAKEHGFLGPRIVSVEEVA
jgi:hypothetical protein